VVDKYGYPLSVSHIMHSCIKSSNFSHMCLSALQHQQAVQFSDMLFYFSAYMHNHSRQTHTHYHIYRKWYGDSACNTAEEISIVFCLIWMCYQQGHAGSKTLFQQNPPVLNWGCQLTQVVLYNGRKTVVVVAYTSIYVRTSS